jgi:hypothetical protein
MTFSRSHRRVAAIGASWRLMLCFGVIGGLAWPVLASAEDSDAEGPRAEAVRLGGEGAAAYKEGRYADALNRFDAAYRTYPAPALLLNLSRTELKLEQCEESLRYAHLYRAAGNNREVAYSESPVSWLAYVESQCPEVEIRTDPDHARIRVSGSPQADDATTPWTGRLFAGAHSIVLKHSGFADNQDTLDVQSGSAQTFFFVLNASGGAPARRAAAPDVSPPSAPPVPVLEHRPSVEENRPRPAWTLTGPRTPRARAAFDVTVAITAAAAVVGIVGGATALAAAGNPSVGADAASFSAAQPVIQARATTANVGFSLAGAGLITSIVFWLKGDSIFPEPSGLAHGP